MTLTSFMGTTNLFIKFPWESNFLLHFWFFWYIQWLLSIFLFYNTTFSLSKYGFLTFDPHFGCFCNSIFKSTRQIHIEEVIVFPKSYTLGVAQTGEGSVCFLAAGHRSKDHLGHQCCQRSDR